MLSLSTIIRVYIILSITIMISFFVMLTSVDVILKPAWGILSSDIESIYSQLYVAVIIMSLIGITIGVIISIFIFNRGINKYKDILRRFDNLDQYAVIRPSTLYFPEQDEFGNIGKLLNIFIQKMDNYDRLKTQLAKSEQEKFEQLSQYTPHPILLINTSTNEPFISFYNQCFRDLFLKKSVFIDIQGKPQTQYHNLEGTPVAYFSLKTEESESFFPKQQLDIIKNKQLIGEKKHIFTNITYQELSGSKKYIFEQVIYLPIMHEIDQTVAQVMYIFINGQTVEKENLNTAKLI